MWITVKGSLAPFSLIVGGRLVHGNVEGDARERVYAMVGPSGRADPESAGAGGGTILGWRTGLERGADHLLEVAHVVGGQ